MDDTLKLILDILETRNPKYIGINFLQNYLRDTCDERVIEGKRIKFPLYGIFRHNVINAPKMLNTKETWEKINTSGDVRDAFISAFDWDKTPEGYDFWHNANERFQNQYQEAKLKGLKYNDLMPQVIATSYAPQNVPTEVICPPTDETLNLLRYLSPICEHPTNEQIDVFLDVLDTFNCTEEFFANLRTKPKRQGFEMHFKDYCEGKDLRSLVYWAFEWSKVKEGYTFWSQVSDAVNATIASECIFKKDKPTSYNPHVTTTPCGSQIMRVDPITHTNNVMQQHYPPHGVCDYLYDDEWDEGYGFFDYWQGYRNAYYKPSIPKDIINMPTNNNYIGIASEVKEFVTI